MNFFISSPLNTCNCFVLNWFFEGSITPTIGLKTIFRSMTYCRKNPFRASYAFLILLCDRPLFFCIRLMIESWISSVDTFWIMYFLCMEWFDIRWFASIYHNCSVLKSAFVFIAQYLIPSLIRPSAFVRPSIFARFFLKLFIRRRASVGFLLLNVFILRLPLLLQPICRRAIHLPLNLSLYTLPNFLVFSFFCLLCFNIYYQIMYNLIHFLFRFTFLPC